MTMYKWMPHCISRLSVAACILMLSTGCTHQVVMPTENLWQPAGQQERKTPVVSVLRVEDAVTNPEQQKDPKSLGQDTSHWGFLGPIPLRHDVNQYQTEQARADVVQDGLATVLTKMGLPAIARPEAGPDQVRAAPEGHLILQTTLRAFEVTNENSLIILLIANAGHLRKLNAQVTLDCQLVQSGHTAPLWQGTVEGRAQWDAGEYSDMEIEQNVKWNQERGTVLRQAMEDAVGNLVIKSGIRQLSAKLQSEAQARFLTKVQERETTGDMQGALTLYMQAYRSAMNSEQSSTAVAGIARVLRRVAVKPTLPEEARKFGVQAGSLVEKKRYDDAVVQYEKALEVAPWWAEGHFNRALVLATQNRFSEAMVGMKHFVILAPDSPDARSAQDKLYEWELEAQQQSASTNGSSSVQTPSQQLRSAIDAAAKGSGQGRSAAGAFLGPVK